LERAANTGSRSDMWELGTMHEFGRCVHQNYSVAVKWYRKSADAGLPVGMESLGTMYEFGRGVGKNRREALKWYTRAAERGWEPAMMSAARICLSGDTIDYANAKRWLQAATDKDDTDAMGALGDMYRKGQTGEHDYSAALDWYKRGVEKRNQGAALRIGRMYLTGEGVTRDAAQAYFWLTLAAFNHSFANSPNERSAAKARLDKAKIKEIENDVLQWVTAHLDPQTCGQIGIVPPCQPDDRWPASGLPH